MRIVRYKARTMQDALQQVRGELGPDAIILSTRTLPRRLRWLGKEQVEVVAAAGSQGAGRPDEPSSEPKVQGPGFKVREPEAPGVGGSNGDGRAPSRAAAAEPRSPRPESRSAPSDTADLHREIREIRETLARLAAWTAPKDDVAETIVACLVERGMSSELARELTAKAAGRPAEEAWAEIRSAAIARIRVSGPIEPPARGGESSGPGPETGDQRPETRDPGTQAGVPRANGRRSRARRAPVGQESGLADAVAVVRGEAPQDGPLVVALVGPTGVGKTTTVAKLAARCAIMDRRKVALVTLDTYRVAAVDQIRTYAQMLDVPLEVVVSADDAGAMMARLRDYEMVLVDTIGHGPNDEMQLGQLRMLLASVKPHQVHLVLAAPTDRRTMQNAVERFSRLEPTHLLFTKVDEAVVFGAMVDVAVRSEWPVSYVSYGQDVPESIAPATAEQLAEAACMEEQ